VSTSKPPKDWKRELEREEALRLRYERWHTDSLHIFKIARKIIIAWVLLRHGVDIEHTILTIIGEPDHAFDALTGIPGPRPSP
jgi:hypothetical protein